MSDILETPQITNNQSPKIYLLCQRFLGSPQLNDYCSKCYKEHKTEWPQNI